MSRPETPKTSVAVRANLILAVSNSFSRRLRPAIRLSTSLRRYRVKSRSSRMGEGGASLEMLVLHDDAQREYAYGPAQGSL
jgi:hypothetical protein